MCVCVLVTVVGIVFVSAMMVLGESPAQVVMADEGFQNEVSGGVPSPIIAHPHQRLPITFHFEREFLVLVVCVETPRVGCV